MSSGTEKEDALTAPKGWMRVADANGFHYSPDPRHPMHPYQKGLRSNPKLRTWLKSDPVLAQFVNQYRDQITEQLDKISAQVKSGSLTDQQRAELERVTDNYLRHVFAAIDQACSQASQDLPYMARFNFLVEQFVPEQYRGRITSLSPVAVHATPNGQIALMFTGATPADRTEWNELIREAQKFFGHRKDKGGRPPRKEQNGADPRLAARLSRCLGLSTPEIAQILQWSHPEEEWIHPHEDGTEERITRRVARYIDAGTEALDEEYGNGWRDSISIPNRQKP